MSDDTILGLRNRVDRLEEQVRLLSEQAGIPYDDGTGGIPPEVVELVNAGNRLKATKRYAELTGTDLKTAQQVVAGL